MISISRHISFELLLSRSKTMSFRNTKADVMVTLFLKLMKAFIATSSMNTALKTVKTQQVSLIILFILKKTLYQNVLNKA